MDRRVVALHDEKKAGTGRHPAWIVALSPWICIPRTNERMNEQASDFAPNRNPNGARSRSAPPTRPCCQLSGRNTTNGSRTHKGNSVAARQAAQTRARRETPLDERPGAQLPYTDTSHLPLPLLSASSRLAPNPNPNPTTARTARPPDATLHATPRLPSSIASIAPIAADDATHDMHNGRHGTAPTTAADDGNEKARERTGRDATPDTDRTHGSARIVVRPPCICVPRTKVRTNGGTIPHRIAPGNERRPPACTVRPSSKTKERKERRNAKTPGTKRSTET
ncbi:hypothetical protein MSAN_00109200 [Mycena sanguinolenta]|uniref:Uncharacterized protein n=1 Tax=Mycena sanguinolenta TaxID=230812 RepID=A0A8H7DIS3_9AGAR|nr:hypothetical protein MSAN_00109200 [Mycena sanguinolenta]